MCAHTCTCASDIIQESVYARVQGLTTEQITCVEETCVHTHVTRLPQHVSNGLDSEHTCINLAFSIHVEFHVYKTTNISTNSRTHMFKQSAVAEPHASAQNHACTQVCTHAYKTEQTCPHKAECRSMAHCCAHLCLHPCLYPCPYACPSTRPGTQCCACHISQHNTHAKALLPTHMTT